MGNFRNKLLKFFSGRYGIDEFGRFLVIVYMVLIILSSVLGLFCRGVGMLILRILIFAFGVYTVYRMMSRKIYVRRNENEKYKVLLGKIRATFRLTKNRFRDRKTHVYRKCPYCKAVLRLKKIKGKHRAACPRCGNSFDVKV